MSLLFISSGVQGQIGGACEGCEAALEYDPALLRAVDTLPLFGEEQPRLKITGTIYQHETLLPAKDVVVYIYHTDRNGGYPKSGNESGWGRRHGYLRGWAKTGVDGTYTFYSFRPAAYPGGAEPEHIHITIKEPGKAPYYIDEITFDDDPLLTPVQRSTHKNRAGSGVVIPVVENGTQIICRDIMLGVNIPNYD